MKNATLILATVCLLSSCAGGRGGSKTALQTKTTGSKDNQIFAWLSSTAAPQTVSR